MSLERSPVRRWRRARLIVSTLLGLGMLLGGARGDSGGERVQGPLVVIAYNDLGMHCMNDEFSELVILPPFNNVRAQVIERGIEPEILGGDDVTLSYVIPSNTHSADKTNFWTYAEALFGVPLPPNVGLTGNGMSGTMEPIFEDYYEVTGIPITPIEDTGRLNPYPLATITAMHNDGRTAVTQTVVPVSSEISCNLCHGAEGVSVATDILRDHDTLHGTDLENAKPVLCASCHADPALGLPGNPDLPNLSLAMHAAHAPRMDLVNLDNTCYACHPGIRTQCQRDVHLANEVECMDCHGGMLAVGDPARTPWVDEPRCSDCHDQPGFEFEQPGKLFKDSIGHGGVQCAICHGSPHAITPAMTATDNLQAILLQGQSGVISNCLVCHSQQPDEPFFHSVED